MQQIIKLYAEFFKRYEINCIVVVCNEYLQAN